ncbi:MAG: prephenate dehydratase [Synergistetes bacterium]|nr:prephenate dehydratase [Synergistota bacterium]MCX8128144.1 prephenate dehydratase [Synergistota bacterium]MDW8192520.1 prephenate dehydratase [Synergistota bacterium]
MLEELRKKISEIDDKIKALLDERANIAKKIGEYKKKEGLPLWDPQREQEILIWAGKYKDIFREIIGFCRTIQEPIKVCFLGPEGSFSHQAAIKLFSHYTELIPCKNFRELFDAVEGGKSNFSILPIDNSLAGPVGEVLDLLLERNVYIVGEKYEKIDICLLSNKNFEEIKEVYSHPHALEQCRNYLAEKLPNANIISVDSTSKAALLAKEKNEAALGSELLSKTYDLKIIDKSIQDRKNNYTRFIVISKEPSEGDKTSLIFSVKNVPGALHRALGPFAKREIDLTSIHSRPVKTKPWDYIFFMDFKGSLKDNKVKEALRELEEISTFIKILGSYPLAQVT